MKNNDISDFDEILNLDVNETKSLANADKNNPENKTEPTKEENEISTPSINQSEQISLPPLAISPFSAAEIIPIKNQLMAKLSKDRIANLVLNSTELTSLLLQNKNKKYCVVYKDPVKKKSYRIYLYLQDYC